MAEEKLISDSDYSNILSTVDMVVAEMVEVLESTAYSLIISDPDTSVRYFLYARFMKKYGKFGILGLAYDTAVIGRAFIQENGFGPRTNFLTTRLAFKQAVSLRLGYILKRILPSYDQNNSMTDELR